MLCALLLQCVHTFYHWSVFEWSFGLLNHQSISFASVEVFRSNHTVHSRFLSCSINLVFVNNWWCMIFRDDSSTLHINEARKAAARFDTPVQSQTSARTGMSGRGRFCLLFGLYLLLSLSLISLVLWSLLNITPLLLLLEVPLYRGRWWNCLAFSNLRLFLFYLPYILAYRSRHRIGRTISFVLKKFNLELTRT